MEKKEKGGKYKTQDDSLNRWALRVLISAPQVKTKGIFLGLCRFYRIDFRILTMLRSGWRYLKKKKYGKFPASLVALQILIFFPNLPTTAVAPSFEETSYWVAIWLFNSLTLKRVAILPDSSLPFVNFPGAQNNQNPGGALPRAYQSKKVDPNRSRDKCNVCCDVLPRSPHFETKTSIPPATRSFDDGWLSAESLSRNCPGQASQRQRTCSRPHGIPAGSSRPVTGQVEV